MKITQDGPFLVVEHERFVARFPADRSGDLEQLQDQDIYVTFNLSGRTGAMNLPLKLRRRSSGA